MLSAKFGRLQILGLGVAALAFAMLVSTATAQDEEAETSPATGEVPLVYGGPTETHALATSAGHHAYHILPANTEAGRHAPLDGPESQFNAQAAAAKAKPLAGLAKPGFFPADLSYLGGLFLVSGTSANIYYNCADESCWGDPEGFLNDLAASKFIHVTDQYIGSKKNGRYPFSAVDTSHPSGPTSLDTTAIENLVHAAALQFGPHIFHVFLPAGVDVCPEVGVCYSPDRPLTFAFCAYHSAASFAEFNIEIPYTVEPFQNVPGCQLAGPNPHNQLIDSTDSALSHELFETITDPFSDDPAWLAENSQPEEGNEVADICHGIGNGNGEAIVPSFTLVKGRTYQLQLEYANSKHGCVTAP